MKLIGTRKYWKDADLCPVDALVDRAEVPLIGARGRLFCSIFTSS